MPKPKLGARRTSAARPISSKARSRLRVLETVRRRHRPMTLIEPRIAVAARHGAADLSRSERAGFVASDGKLFG